MPYDAYEIACTAFDEHCRETFQGVTRRSLDLDEMRLTRLGEAVEELAQLAVRTCERCDWVNARLDKARVVALLVDALDDIDGHALAVIETAAKGVGK